VTAADEVASAAGVEPLPPSSAPTAGGSPRRFSRAVYLAFAHLPALVPMAVIIAIVLALVFASGLMPLNQFFSFHYNPGNTSTNTWGIGYFVVGSFLTAVPALLFSMLIGLGIAVSSTAYLPKVVSRFLDPFVDLLAGIPSVVYGIWAVLVIGPYFGLILNPWLNEHFGFIPGFGGQPGLAPGLGLDLAVFVLTLMALPITTLLIRDALNSVPRDLWESGLALGATRWEVVRKIAIPYSRRGIVSAGFLGFGRAFGETVAVAMTIGFSPQVPSNIYGFGGTMASAMFELLDGAYGNSHFLAFLAELGLMLFAITLAVNIIGRRLISNLAHFEVAGL
jgi:phosphate transport system permease protein